RLSILPRPATFNTDSMRSLLEEITKHPWILKLLFTKFSFQKRTNVCYRNHACFSSGLFQGFVRFFVKTEPRYANDSKNFVNLFRFFLRYWNLVLSSHRFCTFCLCPHPYGFTVTDGDFSNLCN